MYEINSTTKLNKLNNGLKKYALKIIKIPSNWILKDDHEIHELNTQLHVVFISVHTIESLRGRKV